VFGAVLTTAAVAHTNYKCNDPRTPIDRRACEAAKQGPDALRRFIERMRVIESLDFYDYMTDAQLLAWRQVNEPTRTAVRESR
jgi:hypothetical protein